MQLRCEFHNEPGKVNHWTCPSFPEVHYDRDQSSKDLCAIVVNNIEEHHEGKNFYRLSVGYKFRLCP